METETAAAAPASKKRRTEAHEGRESEASLTSPPQAPLPPTDARSGLTNGPEPEGSHDQEPPCGAGGEEEDAVDRISLLPDAILGEIVSLLPTKDAARTQALASRWRGIWLSSPLNLDCSGGGLHAVEQVEADLVSRILAAHPGPVRRLSVPVLHLHRRPATIDIWLRSQALDKLQELEFDNGDKFFYDYWLYCSSPRVTLPISALRFSATLRVLTISRCNFPESVVEVLHFPQLRLLGLEGVEISDDSLNSIISGSPVLECLFVCVCVFGSIRIKSPSLVSLGFYCKKGNVIIEDAPSLERLLQLENRSRSHVSVISAPKLETLGCLCNNISSCYISKYTFGFTILEELKVNGFTTEVRSVKILAIYICQLDLDTIIDLIRFFPCLEKLYIQMTHMSGGSKNLWSRKHRDLLKCLDIRLKTVVLKGYRGINSQVNFAKFFLQNAKRLELMRFEGTDSREGLLQLEKRASRCARVYFTRTNCYRFDPHIKHVGDLTKTDPFECGSMCAL